jgi:hypothetical protein
MANRLWLVCALLAAVCAATGAKAAAGPAAPRTVTIRLPAAPGSRASVRMVRAQIYDLGPAKTAELRFSGQLGAAQVQAQAPAQVLSLAQAAKIMPRTLIVAAGYSGRLASVPSGLLFVKGVTINPLVPPDQAVGGIRFDTVVCFDRQGTDVTMYGPGELANMQDVRQECISAFQAYPRILDDGNAKFSRTSPGMPSERPRVVYGGDINEVARLIVFLDPIGLDAAAAFLREHDDRQPTSTASIKGDHYQFTGGAGLINAVSLGEDGNPAVIFMGKPVIGDPYRPAPSLMVFNY